MAFVEPLTTRHLTEDGGDMMKRARAALADEGNVGNPLYPITPVRLAFLTRDVLEDDLGISQADMFSAMWERRAELAERVATELTGYRRAVRTYGKQARFWRTLRSMGWLAMSLSVLIALGVTAYLLARHEMVPLTRARLTSRPGYALAGCAAGFALGGIPAALAAMKQRATERRYLVAYQELLGKLLPNLADMARQVIQLKDEQASGVLLAPVTAPSLVESGTPAVVQSASFREVLGLVEGHVSSAIGIVGSRGAGKSTLLRLLSSTSRPERGRLPGIGAFVVRSEQSAGLPAPRIGVSLTAPADPAAGDFVKVIYATTVRKVLASNNVSAGGRPSWRQRFRVQPQDDLALAQQALERITGSLSLSRSKNVGVTRYGMSVGLGKQRTWTERDLSHADWVADFRDYLERHHLRGGASILIAVDELDKIADAARATEIINGLKDLFHVDGVHFVISVSDDALRSFATRGIPVRDTFDSAFDTVIEIPPMSASESCELLRARVRYFPYSAALFCHAWSGGLPRDLIRTARACVTILNATDGPIPVADLAQRIIRRDLLHFVDAAISQDRADINQLLTIRHDLIGGSPLWDPQRRAEPSGPDDGLMASLSPLLGIASTIAEYFAVARSPEEWTSGLQSGALLADADLLAQARAGLSVHPAEAEWRMQQARDTLGLKSPGATRKRRRRSRE